MGGDGGFGRLMDYATADLDFFFIPEFTVSDYFQLRVLVLFLVWSRKNVK